MTKAIILTHGNLGSALLETASKIIGPQNNIKALTNEEISMRDLVLNLDEALKEWKGEDVLIFIDFMGGSCWNAAQIVKKDKPNLALISGVSLPMLLSYYSKRDSYQLSDLAAYLKECVERSTVTESS